MDIVIKILQGTFMPSIFVMGLHLTATIFDVVEAVVLVVDPFLAVIARLFLLSIHMVVVFFRGLRGGFNSIFCGWSIANWEKVEGRWDGIFRKSFWGYQIVIGAIGGDEATCLLPASQPQVLVLRSAKFILSIPNPLGNEDTPLQRSKLSVVAKPKVCVLFLVKPILVRLAT